MAQSPLERYNNDPQYRTLVDALEGFIHKAQFSPSELRECAVLACVHYEMRNGFKHYTVPSGVNDAFKALAKWREAQSQPGQPAA